MTLLSLLFSTPSFVICLVFMVLLIIAIRLGYYIGGRKPKVEGLGSIETSIYALLGLLIAFTFGMGNTRYEGRVDVVTQEANNIGTAILRADLYPDTARKAFREDFKKYIETREAYFKQADDDKIDSILAQSEVYQMKIWNRAIFYSKDPKFQLASMQMIPALNAMIDIVTTREVKNEHHIPEGILYLLFCMSLAAGFFTGYINAHWERKDWLPVVGFALLISAVLFTILDIDRPRRGLIRTDKVNQHILDLKKSL